MYCQRKIVVGDPVLNAKRMAVVMRWNNISHAELQRELNYGNRCFERLMAGIESPDDLDMTRLSSMFGATEMLWVLGRMNTMPPWLQESA